MPDFTIYLDFKDMVFLSIMAVFIGSLLLLLALSKLLSAIQKFMDNRRKIRSMHGES